MIAYNATFRDQERWKQFACNKDSPPPSNACCAYLFVHYYCINFHRKIGHV